MANTTDSTKPNTVTLEKAKRLHVFTIKNATNGAIWLRCGCAYVNKDGSINVYLDALPLDGKLHIREVTAKQGTGTTEPAAA